MVLPPPSHLQLETPSRLRPRPLAPTYLPRIPSPRGWPLGPHLTRCPRPPGQGCPAAGPPLQTAWGWGTGRRPRGPGSAGGQGHLQSGGPLFSLPLPLALGFLLLAPSGPPGLVYGLHPGLSSDLHGVAGANPAARMRAHPTQMTWAAPSSVRAAPRSAVPLSAGQCHGAVMVPNLGGLPEGRRG